MVYAIFLMKNPIAFSTGVAFATIFSLASLSYAQIVVSGAVSAPTPAFSNANNLGGSQEIYPTEDTTSLIRNPAMGWGLYDEASNHISNAGSYWAVQNQAARKYASFFYLRCTWSDLEPQEGKYAWVYDSNFQNLIKGALDRGLKLAFRVDVNGQDGIKPATPEYVKTAGAKGYQTHGRGGKTNWTPYPDDPIFQAKFAKFVQAFAKEFDNPSKVDFVDGNGLGQWGEGNNIKTLHHDQLSVFKWVINLYANNFKKALLVTNLASQEGFAQEKIVAYDGNDFLPRRDGLGSRWYTETQKREVISLFPKMPLIGESCYWQNDNGFNTDPAYKNFKHPVTWHDVFELTYKDAIESHANALDLRQPLETNRWITIAPELVQKFVINGGYRFYPYELSLPKQMNIGKSFQIKYGFRNTGVGMCPNNNKRWNHKYKVAFALIQRSNMQVRQVFYDPQADPSKWIKGSDCNYSFNGTVSPQIRPGDYIIGLAIIDTSNNTIGLQLAIKNLQKTHNGWYALAAVHVSK